MIKIENKDDKVILIAKNAEDNKYQLKINNEIIIKANSNKKFNTGLIFISTQKNEEIFFKGNILEKNGIFVDSEKFDSDKNESQEIQVNIINLSNEDYTIELGRRIGNIYTCKKLSLDNKIDNNYKEIYSSNDFILLQDEESDYIVDNTTLETDIEDKNRVLTINMSKHENRE